MSGGFLKAVSSVEGVGAAVDREDVQDEVLAPLAGVVEELADEVPADAATLVIGVDLDAGQVDLGRAVFHDQDADIRTVGGDDLPPVWVEPARVEFTLDCVVPPQIAAT